MALVQNSVPVSLSIWYASSTVLGNRMPNLCVVFQYRDLTLLIMRLRFLRTCGTHQRNAGSLSIRLATAYSAISMGLVSLSSRRGIQSVVPSFHSTSSSHPFVVRRGIRLPPRVTRIPSSLRMAVPSDLWSVISLRRAYWRPSPSTCEKMFSAMMLAKYSAVVPSENSTSYCRVSSNGLSCLVPIGRPSSPRSRLVTLAGIRSPSLWSNNWAPS